MENNDEIKTKFFEEHYEEINSTIEKRRRKLQLKAIPSLDFDDIKQILFRHIYIKIHLYDKNKSPFLNWLNRLISNQISNILRNNFYAISRPCLKCCCSLPSDGCELYNEQSSQCVIYKHWEDTKKSAHSIRLPLPSENHLQEIFNIPHCNSDIQSQILEFHAKIKLKLKPFEQKIYYYLFEIGLSEPETAKKLNYRSIERFKYPGYASIAKAKKIIIIKAKKMIEDGEIDII